jgi:lysophospholipase L1-like esterase
MRSKRAVAAVAASLLALAAAPGAAQAQWVGLGDSFAAGPLIPSQTLNPLGCLRSTRNFARLAAASTGRSLVDVSCSGARTDHMFNPQSTSAGTNPPQLNAVTSAARVVSLQIGGNDIGFSEILETCSTVNPFGRPCQNRYVRNGVDELRARIAATAPKVAAVLTDIKRRAPQARVLLVNYASILPNSGSGCWPQVPLAWADVPYVRGIHLALNQMLSDQARAAGVVYVDSYTPSLGRDACRGTTTRWVEPLVPGNAAAPFHPNARGMAGIAPVVAAAS